MGDSSVDSSGAPPLRLGQICGSELGALLAWARPRGVELSPGQVQAELSLWARRGDEPVGLALYRPQADGRGLVELVLDEAELTQPTRRMLLDKALRKLAAAGLYHCRLHTPHAEALLSDVNWLKRIASEEPAGV